MRNGYHNNKNPKPEASDRRCEVYARNDLHVHSLDGGEARLRQLDQTRQETGLVSWGTWLAVGPTSDAVTDHLQGQQSLQEFPAGQVNRLTRCQTTFDDLVHSLALQVLIVPVR